MKPHYELFAEARFSAAHSLTDYPGNCSHLHGHNWKVRVYVCCEKLDNLGIAIDFRTVKTHLKEVLDTLDHTFLNDLPPFAQLNPTSENIARYVYGEMKKRLEKGGPRLSRVEVAETPETGVIYWEGE
jgi:6-pyruvoyltetrahydropterin/6-carboxytetrahydropterin synthase